MTRDLIPGRAWLHLQWNGPFYGFRHNFLPWMSCDEYYRRTLVLPFGPAAIIIALWHTNTDDIDDPTYQRWRRIHDTHGPITRKSRGPFLGHHGFFVDERLPRELAERFLNTAELLHGGGRATETRLLRPDQERHTILHSHHEKLALKLTIPIRIRNELHNIPIPQRPDHPTPPKRRAENIAAGTDIYTTLKPQ